MTSPTAPTFGSSTSNNHNGNGSSNSFDCKTHINYIHIGIAAAFGCLIYLFVYFSAAQTNMSDSISDIKVSIESLKGKVVESEANIKNTILIESKNNQDKYHKNINQIKDYIRDLGNRSKL